MRIGVEKSVLKHLPVRFIFTVKGRERVNETRGERKKVGRGPQKDDGEMGLLNLLQAVIAMPPTATATTLYSHLPQTALHECVYEFAAV